MFIDWMKTKSSLRLGRVSTANTLQYGNSTRLPLTRLLSTLISSPTQPLKPNFTILKSPRLQSCLLLSHSTFF